MSTPIKIFIAEDDQDDLDIFKEALSEVNPNVEIHSFSDGEALMQKINSKDSIIPDLIFLDINMPYLTGKQCLSQIRDDLRFIRTPVIMFTTSGTREDIMESFYAGATRFITKPNEYRGLINVFEQLFLLYANRRLTKTDLMNFAMKPYILKGEVFVNSQNQFLF